MTDNKRDAGQVDAVASAESELSADEIAEAEAAVALATLPEDDRLPDHVRERVEAGGKAFLGERAKNHARKRAEDQGRDSAQKVATAGAQPLRALQSTTSAGSQIVGIDEREPSRAARPSSLSKLSAWGGWAFAAAAAVALFATRSPALSSRSAGEQAVTSPVVQRFALSGPGNGAGWLEYDRTHGTFKTELTRAPNIDAQRESMQLWLAFDGEGEPRPIAILDATGASNVLRTGTVCQANPGRGMPGSTSPSCLPVVAVVVTREAARGALLLDRDRVVLQGRPSP